MIDRDDHVIRGISGEVYIKQDVVGSGAFGKVTNVQNQKTGERFVCKTEVTIERYTTLLYESWVI